jgi:hypothetical protein
MTRERGKEKENQEYIFRYELKLDRTEKPLSLSELFKFELENLLDIIIPMEGNREVKIDGFKFIAGGAIHKLFNGSRLEGAYPDDWAPDILYEPRIQFIKRQCQNLLSVIELETDHKAMKPNTFRLKNLSDWLVHSSCDPNEIIAYLGTSCNCSCIMCCNRGNPPVVPLNRTTRTSEEELQELRTRVQYFSPQAGMSLFPSPGSVHEVLAHPHCLEILSLLRRKSARPFRIATNGTRLTGSFIGELVGFMPMYLYLSLNSCSVSRRKRLMNDPEPEIAINALPILAKAGIPYAATIVPWPVDSINEMLDDLASTVEYAESNMAHLIQINLPSYSRHLPQQPIFDLDEVWPAIVAEVRRLRNTIDCPIVAMPCMYEENIYEKRLGVPQLIGLVKNSPAYVSGLARHDIILEINGIRLYSRAQARELLSIIQRSDVSRINIKVQRGGDTLDFMIPLTEYSYPYSKDTDNHIGMIFLGTGLANYIEKLIDLAERYKAQHILFLSSRLVRPAFEQQLGESNLLGSKDLGIDIEIPDNSFFGGNIFMGDLLIVQDFIDCIEKYKRKARHKPDLIIIPSSPFALGGWRRDLTSRAYLDIERAVGIPVELLDCSPIYE